MSPPRPLALIAATMLGCGLLLPNAAGADEKASISIPLTARQMTLDEQAVQALAPVVTRLHADRGLRVRVAAHSSMIERSTEQARRASLLRARAVWEYLTGRGVERRRIDVWALAAQSSSGAPDRIDVIVENE